MKMSTGYLSELSKVVVKEFDVPDFDEHSVLVKVKAAGICGSDLHAFHGSHPFRKAPMILGHEAAGEVVKVGAKVKQLKVGDRIAVEPIKACGKCSYCLSGNYNLCPERVIAGVRGWLGTFAEYFVLPEQRAHKLPPELDYDLGVLAEPLAVGTHAVRLANIKKGSTCVVLEPERSACSQELPRRKPALAVFIAPISIASGYKSPKLWACTRSRQTRSR